MPNFDDDDWQELLAELRLIVIGAGFTDWDASMIRSLGEDRDDADLPLLDRDDSRRMLFSYIKGLQVFLSVRSSRSLSRLQVEYQNLLEGEGRSDVRLADPAGGRGISLFEGRPSDHLVDEIEAFVRALNEDDSYFDGPEFEA